MSKEIYRCRLEKEESSTETVEVSAMSYGNNNERHKIKLDNVAFRLNDDNRTHYEAISANITIDATRLPELIEALHTAQQAIKRQKMAG